MVKIRLARAGAKKKPYYHVVVADARSKRDGKFIEKIGHYNPMDSKNRSGFKWERIDHWVSVGAQPTDKVKRLINEAKKSA